MELEDVQARMEYFYRFEATKEIAERVEQWLVTGRTQNLSNLVKDGVLKIKRKA